MFWDPEGTLGQRFSCVIEGKQSKSKKKENSAIFLKVYGTKEYPNQTSFQALFTLEFMHRIVRNVEFQGLILILGVIRKQKA